MIKITKIVTGEEIVGDVTFTDTHITIKDPCAIAYVPSKDQPGQQALGLVPYAAYTKDHSVTIEKSKVVWSEELVEEVYNQYNKVFGSGIQIFSGKV